MKSSWHFKQYKATVWYIFIIALIFLPLIKAGYIQSLDMPWGPRLNNVELSNDYWLLVLNLHYVGDVITQVITQKVFLISIYLIAILGVYDFPFLNQKGQRYIGGLLYVFNPYVYTRLMAGQWLVLLGYALLPWAIAYWWQFLQAPSWRRAWPFALWFAAIGLTSIHTVGIFLLAAIVMALFSGRQQLKPKLAWGATALGVFLVINAIWLIPLLTGQSPTSQNINSFGQSQFQAFATQGTVLHSVPLSAALLTGFWADSQNRYILPSSLPIWWLGVVIIATLVLVGGVKTYRNRDRLGLALMTSGFIAWLLGMGIAWGGSAWLTRLLLHLVPFYNGYREPQKWLMLLALAYAYLAAVGAAAIYARLKNYRWQPAAAVFTVVALLAPFLFAPTLAWGAGGQLKSADYPAGWYQAKTYLNAQHLPANTKVLSLPWHLYLPLKFTGRVVANPSNYFFDQQFITGNNFELRGVPNQNPTPLTNYVGNRLVVLTSEQQHVGAKLQERGVQYVMLLKEADWQRYNWLNQQPDMAQVVNNDSLILYKVTP